MKERKIPMRTCCVTREKLPKQDLLRVVRTPEGTVTIDLVGKMNGRGAYIKKDLAILERSKKTKALERCLEVEIKEDVYEQIKQAIGG